LLFTIKAFPEDGQKRSLSEVRGASDGLLERGYITGKLQSYNSAMKMPYSYMMPAFQSWLSRPGAVIEIFEEPRGQTQT
jgi:hypothetical protein